ncbi:hypothetical protein LX87_05452 [Larkinella arboricola]|uniref:Lipoprotein n=1 Tax=Larkinella arboricola TaxID=643671 RepID=A0A327WJ56_LARAB|nr:hypothetical protein [Larkinella arboricola]RAJ90823.1 hypothetical protein LX87_05452 [Larkinella arboricola]
MKHLVTITISLFLIVSSLSCSDSGNPSAEPPRDIASTRASKGLAIYLADPGDRLGTNGNCQVNLTKFRLVGQPLTESDIDYFDQKQGFFKLKVSLYEWLSKANGPNSVAIDSLTKEHGSYYAIALTLDGTPVFGGYVLSRFSSHSCVFENQPYFANNLPNLPTTEFLQSEEPYQLPLVKALFPSTLPNKELINRLKAISKLKD